MKENRKKAYIILTVALLALAPAFGRSSVNIAANSANAEDFFLEKQKHDAALSADIEFYPLDSWYFALLLSKHSDLLLQNTYAPGLRDLYGTAESSYLWYMDIAGGLYPEYADFIPYANYVIAKCLRTGCGVIKNYSKSREFAERAYKAGFAGGNLLIAEEIEGCWADKETAKLSVKKLYDSAASEEFPESFICLAKRTGGTDRKKFLDKAMKFNVAEAYYLAAQDILALGVGNVTDDSAAELLETASVLLEEAEALFHAKSAMLLGDFYAGLIPVQTEYSTPLCRKQSNPFHNQEKAEEYYMNAAMYGEARGFAALAAIYREGYFGTTDKNMASFYYYKYRDALYDEKLAYQEKMEQMRAWYEDEGNGSDETVCLDLGLYYTEAETEDGEKDSLAWLNEGAKKGSAYCMFVLGERYRGKQGSLNFYRQSINSANKFPLNASRQAKALSELDNIYAQVLQGIRFKNDVEYWLNSMDDKNFIEKKETEKNTELLKVATKTEAMKWFKTRAESGGKFEKTWYAWLLLEDNEATSKYNMKAASVRPDKDVAAAWGLVQDALKEDPEYAPALLCQGRCQQNGYGTRKKAKDARESFEAAANLNYSEAWGWLAVTARDQAEQKEFITNGCSVDDEYSYYLSFSFLIWLPGQTDIKESLIAAVKYGYIESYEALIKQRIQDVSVTFDGDYSNLDDAYRLAVFAETAGISTAKDQRLYIEKYYSDKMTLSAYTVNEAINKAKKKVSSNAENADALYTLAEAYTEAGSLVNGSDELAAKYYLMAAKLNKVEAMEKMAGCYYNGKGVPKNYDSAFLWYNAAELNGNENVYAIIGTMLIEGEGCERNVEKGLDYYRTESGIHPSSPVVKILNCFDGLPESYSRSKE
ncbi:MAG: sel1 repeat family protein [Treponema sp.]|nr:sel1 repeat family protein [Treponema sp.]